jgi:hypothetical protein
MSFKSRVHGSSSVSLARSVSLASNVRAHALWLSALGALSLVACAAGDGGDDGVAPPPYNLQPSMPGAAGTGGIYTPVAGIGGSSAVPGVVNNGQGGTSTAPAVGQGGSSSVPQAGTGGTGNVNTGTGGTASGTGGTGNVNTGAGGTGGAPPAGTGGTGGDPNQPPPPPAGPDIECPAGATFCSGFEGTAFPAGTQFFAVGGNITPTFEFDDTQAASGNQSLAIPATGSGGFFYRALVVPVPGNEFWVRLQMQVSSTFGDGNHDSLFGGSTGSLTQDVNNEALVEMSEQFDGVLLNTDDAVFRPPALSTISPNTWHCMEGHYNGNNGNVEIFVDGTSVINAAGYRTVTYQTFRLGYMRYNTDRSVWFDDVVVAPARVGCN